MTGLSPSCARLSPRGGPRWLGTSHSGTIFPPFRAPHTNVADAEESHSHLPNRTEGSDTRWSTPHSYELSLSEEREDGASLLVVGGWGCCSGFAPFVPGNPGRPGGSLACQEEVGGRRSLRPVRLAAGSGGQPSLPLPGPPSFLDSFNWIKGLGTPWWLGPGWPFL